IAIIGGYRTPFAKAGTALKEYSADELGVFIINHMFDKVNLNRDEVDEVIFGNVAQPANAANIARVIALKSGFKHSIPAYTVHRNCASGMESITSGAINIKAGYSNIIVAGGTESMSNIPLLYNDKMKAFFEKSTKKLSLIKRLKHLSTFRLSFLKPVIGVVEGLTDPTCNLIMGMTAENLAKDFNINRTDQDRFALNSHHKVAKAIAENKYDDEIVPIPSKSFSNLIKEDVGPRPDQSIEALAKLKPFFDRKNGTVTVGNACPLTDGAASVILMTEEEAKKRNLEPLGYLREFAYAGLDPSRMGLGPVFATSKLLDKTGLTVQDIDLMEMNEAFSVQILANLEAFKSKEFANKFLNKKDPIGEVNPEIVNVNGGAVALGHPVGTSGTRIIITLLRELKRQNKKRGIASLCVGGGQGGACLLEVD
ncbi:acetyl-CoA C-acyltransferase, partial [Candidatus Marinamargulisbacteria bacterium SCGC AG-410-N11]